MIKKTLLGIMVTVCMVSVGHRFYKSWYEHYPLAAVGECLAKSEDSQTKLRIASNNNKTGITTGTIEIDFGFATVYRYGQTTYKELRDAKVKKVSCHARN